MKSEDKGNIEGPRNSARYRVFQVFGYILYFLQKIFFISKALGI